MNIHTYARMHACMHTRTRVHTCRARKRMHACVSNKSTNKQTIIQLLIRGEKNLKSGEKIFSKRMSCIYCIHILVETRWMRSNRLVTLVLLKHVYLPSYFIYHITNLFGCLLCNKLIPSYFIGTIENMFYNVHIP